MGGGANGGYTARPTHLRNRGPVVQRLAVLLLLCAAPAWAGWKAVDENAAGITYADTAAIEHAGDTARMWSLLDYASFQRMVEVGYFSQKTQTEFDCAQRRSRVLALSLRDGHMGEGKAIYADDTAHEWEAVETGSVTEKLWKIACAQ
jgi:hypothetical protein